MAAKKKVEKARKKPAPTAPNTPKLHRRQYMEMVRVGLAPADRDPLVHELTKKLRDTDELRAEAAEVQAGYRRKQKELKEEVDELVLKLDQGVPEKMAVEEIKDFEKGTVTLVRADNRAQVWKRDMTPEDRQLDLTAEAAEEASADADAGAGDDQGVEAHA